MCIPSVSVQSTHRAGGVGCRHAAAGMLRAQCCCCVPLQERLEFYKDLELSICNHAHSEETCARKDVVDALMALDAEMFEKQVSDGCAATAQHPNSMHGGASSWVELGEERGSASTPFAHMLRHVAVVSLSEQSRGQSKVTTQAQFGCTVAGMWCPACSEAATSAPCSALKLLLAPLLRSSFL